MPTDQEIAKEFNLRRIEDVAAKLDIPPDLVEPYGR